MYDRNLWLNLYIKEARKLINLVLLPIYINLKNKIYTEEKNLLTEPEITKNFKTKKFSK